MEIFPNTERLEELGIYLWPFSEWSQSAKNMYRVVNI